nr:unnamed protein product [Callosobruchus chinensis]
MLFEIIMTEFLI